MQGTAQSIQGEGLEEDTFDKSKREHVGPLFCLLFKKPIY